MASRTNCREVICCNILPVRVRYVCSVGPMMGCLRRSHPAKLAAVARALECLCSRSLEIPSVRILRHRSACDSLSDVELPLPCRAAPLHALPCRAKPSRAEPLHALPCLTTPRLVIHAVPRQATPSRAMTRFPCRAQPCHAEPSLAMPSHA